MKPIPIEAAKQIAKAFGYDQIVVIGRAVGKGEHVTTYGKDVANCNVAARIGNFLKFKVMQWSTSSWFDLTGHLDRQRDFSLKTFGPGIRTKGVCDHIRKELSEIEESPEDLEEWVDVILLALDGAWRAGHSAAEICAAIDAKQTKNEARDWPDWRTQSPDKAIEHVRDKADER